MKIITKTERQTIKLGEKIAKGLTGGEVLLLQGNLGSGKTVLAKGIARGLGIKKVVTSPTFILFTVYPVKGHKKIKQLIHADCYRLHNAKDILTAGLADFCGRADTVVVIEWGDRVGKLPGAVKVVLRLKGDGREIQYGV